MGSGLTRRPHLLGKMRDRVTVVGVVRTPDDVGGVSRVEDTTPTSDNTFSAQVIPAGAREQWKYQQLDKVVSWTIFCRYRADLARGVSLLWNGKRLYVEGCQMTDNLNRYLQLDCAEGVNP